MRKLTLDLDQLTVETFEMAVANGQRGTVNGRAQAYETEAVECPTEGETEVEGCIPDEQASIDETCPSMNWCTGEFTCGC